MQLLKNRVLVVCVCGLAGSGKDTFARMLKGVHNTLLDRDRTMDIVTSYTTRPMREGEQMGREHLFVKEVPKDVPLFAYAKYGDAEYWTTDRQMQVRDRTIYVVDEQSIVKILQRSKELQRANQDYKNNPEGDHTMPWQYKVFAIKVDAPREMRVVWCNDIERLNRDKDRNLDVVKWDAVVHNYGSLDDLREQAKSIHNRIMRVKL